MFNLLRGLAVTTLLFSLLLQARAADDCLHPTVTVNVVDNQGQSVAGLDARAFHATLNGQSAVISAVRSETVSRIVIVLDVTRSVTGERSWNLARQASEDIISSSQITTELGLVLYAPDFLKTLDFTHSPLEILESIKQMVDRPKRALMGKAQTALRDAIQQAVELFGTPKVGDTVYVVSDAGENAGQTGSAALEHLLLERRVRLFAFIFSMYAFPTSKMPGGFENVAGLTDPTGGDFAGSEGGMVATKPLQAEVSRLHDQIFHFYSVELSLPTASDKERKLNVEIVDDHGKKRKDLQTKYPKKILTCSAK